GRSRVAATWAGSDRAPGLGDLARRKPASPRVKSFVRHVTALGGKRLPQGRVVCDEGKELTLVGARVQVVIDGPRVRTLVDHVFSNATSGPLSGTFECSLP